MKNQHPLFNLIKDEPFLSKIAEEYGTPVYIYSKKRLIENLMRIKNALENNFDAYLICYTIKANSNPLLIKTLKSYLPSLGADCASPGEIRAAELAGIQPSDCIYTGNYESLSDLKAAFDACVHINLDDINSFQRLIKIGIPDEISFRLNPGFGKGSFSQIVTGGEKAKFGVSHYEIVKAYRIAKEYGISRFGIQCMTGSGVLDPSYYSELIAAILNTVKLLQEELDINMNYISIGGGFGIPYKDSEKPLNFDQIFGDVSTIFNDHFEQENIAKPEFWIEPGKSVIGDAGILLAHVTGIKNSYKTFIGLDAGMETLMRPALYGAYHRIYKVGEPDALNVNTVDITGPICENTDRLAIDREFPKVNEGNLIAVMDTGAYSFSMSHQFCTRPRAAEILLDGDETQLIRRRETIDDIFRNCPL